MDNQTWRLELAALTARHCTCTYGVRRLRRKAKHHLQKPGIIPGCPFAPWSLGDQVWGRPAGPVPRNAQAYCGAHAEPGIAMPGRGRDPPCSELQFVRPEWTALPGRPALHEVLIVHGVMGV